jgi:hypothetical protein
MAATFGSIFIVKFRIPSVQLEVLFPPLSHFRKPSFLGFKNFSNWEPVTAIQDRNCHLEKSP